MNLINDNKQQKRLFDVYFGGVREIEKYPRNIIEISKLILLIHSCYSFEVDCKQTIAYPLFPSLPLLQTNSCGSKNFEPESLFIHGNFTRTRKGENSEL